ncbi:MAG: CopG family transcriptional regulator [Deltaproteobacteria bacterium]|nr:CopG family transcriptional regulator [Deltaproteobacteria bacterium]
MPRLTITLSEERHRALKEAALRRGKTIRQIIEESLEHYGIKTRKEAADLVARARARAGLTEAEALSRAVEETRRERGHGAAPRGD